ncbi:MAG: LPS assembly lipoprotein LptE [Verrucomicrobiota bacterium]
MRPTRLPIFARAELANQSGRRSLQTLLGRTFSSVALLSLASCFLSGCNGYQLGTVKPAIYSDIERIHVPLFANDTLEPRIASLVTNAVLKELQRDGTYRVTTKQTADAVLRGRISEIKKFQLRASRDDTLESQELRVLVYLRFDFVDPVTGAPIASSPGADEDETEEDPIAREQRLGTSQGLVVGETIQFIDPSFQVGERDAISLAAIDGARKLVARLSNGW